MTTPTFDLQLPVSDPAHVLLAAADSAVSAAVQDASGEITLDSATDNGDDTPVVLDLAKPAGPPGAWRQHVAELTADVSPAERAIVGAHLAIHHSVLPAPELLTGKPQRRIDAILDLLDVPFSANDTQSTAAEYGAGLAQVELPAHWSSASVGLALVGGAAGAMFGVPMAYKAGDVSERGMLWWLGRTDLDPQLLARLVDGLVQATALSATEPNDWTLVVDLHNSWLDQLRDRAADAGVARAARTEAAKALQREVSARSTAVLYLRALPAAPDVVFPAGNTMPDLVGLGLVDAEFLLESEGITATSRDGNDSGRLFGGIHAKDHWRVRTQQPVAGTEGVHGAQLTVLKFSDSR